jgi:hypothetical protein
LTEEKKMSNEEQSNAFNEVRAILGKLDRSIDEARSRRLEPDQPAGREPIASPNTPQTPSALDREIGGSSNEQAKTELQKKSATFGRAKPLNGAARPAQAQWKSTGASDDEMIG